MESKLVILTGGSRELDMKHPNFLKMGKLLRVQEPVAPQCPWTKNKQNHFQIDLENETLHHLYNLWSV